MRKSGANAHCTDNRAADIVHGRGIILFLLMENVSLTFHLPAIAA